MTHFQKYAYEELWRYYAFARADGKDGLITGEELSTVAVTCLDSTGTDKSSTMISDAAIHTTKTTAVYKLKGGTAGETYTVVVKVVTTNGQKIEGTATVEVL